MASPRFPPPPVPAAVANLWAADLMDIHNELIELQKEDTEFGSRMQEKELNLVRLGLGLAGGV